MAIKNLKIKCDVCGFNINKINYNKPTFNVYINDKLTTICNNCYNKYFYKNIKKCGVCNKKIEYGVYFLKKQNNYSVICEDCYNKYIKSNKKEE